MQVFRFKMSSLVNDAVYINCIVHEFIHDSIGVHAKFSDIFFTDFLHYFTEAWQLQENFNLIGDVLDNACGIVLRIMGNVLMNQSQVLACWV